MAEWIPPGRIALTDRPERMSIAAHSWLRQRIADWQCVFAAQPGSDWALYIDDVAEFTATLFGAWHAGKRVFLPGDALPGTAQKLRERVAGFVGEWPQEYAPLSASHGCGNVAGLIALDEEAAKLVMFTSGSTGEPAAITKCLRQLVREVEALQAAFGELAEGCRVHGTASHQHIYGLLFRVIWPLGAGREVMPRSFFHEDMLAALAGQDSILIVTPAHLKRLPEQLDWESLRGRLRAVFSSGGPLPADSARIVRERTGVVPIEIFGSSETGGIAWRRWQDDTPIWHALPGVQWRIADGQLEVCSGHIEQPGWWRSEDRAEAAEDDGFRVLGRADKIVKVEERRVSLAALQLELHSHDEVQEARVLLIPGHRSVLGGVVVLNSKGWEKLRRDGKRAYAQSMAAYLAASHDAVTRPRRWRFVESLPVNTSGKVTHAALLALFRPQYPQPLWRIREELRAEIDIVLDPELAAFDGHFEQATILPGVAQLDWAINFGRKIFPISGEFRQIDVLKFQRVLRPGDSVRLSMEWLPEKNALAFRYESSQGAHASGRVVFSDAG